MIVIGGVFVSNERDRECGDQARKERSLIHLCGTLAFAKTGLIARGHFNGGAAARPALDQGSPESSSRLMKVPPSRDLIFFSNLASSCRASSRHSLSISTLMDSRKDGPIWIYLREFFKIR